MDIISEDGYRIDGRKALETRAMAARQSTVDNKLLFELDHGATKVAASIDGPKERHRQKHMVSVDISFLDTTQQEHQGNSEKVRELEKNVRDVFKEVLLLPESSYVEIAVVVKQDDGSVFSTVVNCISLGLCYSGIPMKDVVVGATVGFVSNTFFVDICGAEESYKYPYMTIALMMHRRKIAYLRMAGKIEYEGFNDMFRHGYDASCSMFSEFPGLLKGGAGLSSASEA